MLMKYLVFLAFTALAWQGNNGPRPAAQVAAEFCTCGQPLKLYMAAHPGQAPEDRVEDAAFAQAMAETVTCMGGEAALKALHEGLSVQQQIDYDRQVQTVLSQQCPDVAEAMASIK